MSRWIKWIKLNHLNNMIKAGALALALLLCLPPLPAAADEAPAELLRTRFSVDTGGAEGYVELLLQADVYTAAAHPDLGDLRVLEVESGTPVPYVLYDESREQELVNASFQGHYLSQYEEKGDLYLDFELARLEGHDVYGNQLYLVTDNSNFAKRMTLQGSHDGLAWSAITNDTLYRVEGQERLHFTFDTLIKYPYYRITLPNNKEAIHISAVELRYTAERSNLRRFHGALEHVPFEVARPDANGGIPTTVVTLDTNAMRNLPLTGVELLCDDMFQREVAVQFTKVSEASGFASSTHLNHTTLYNLHFQDLSLRSTTVELDGSPRLGLSLIIRDYDNAPLNIEGVNLTYNAHKLLFKAEPGKQYTIEVGQAALTSPNYDIQSYVGHILENETVATVSCGPPQLLLPEPPAPENTGGGMALSLAVGAASILLLVLIARSLMKGNKGK